MNRVTILSRTLGQNFFTLELSEDEEGISSVPLPLRDIGVGVDMEHTEDMKGSEELIEDEREC